METGPLTNHEPITSCPFVPMQDFIVVRILELKESSSGIIVPGIVKHENISLGEVVIPYESYMTEYGAVKKCDLIKGQHIYFHKTAAVPIPLSSFWLVKEPSIYCKLRMR